MDQRNGKRNTQSVKELRTRLDALAREGSARKRSKPAETEEVRRAVERSGRPNKSGAGPGPIIYERDLPRRGRPPGCSTDPTAPKVALEDAIEGLVMQSSAGKAFVIRTRVDDLEGAEVFSRTFKERVSERDSAILRRVASACDLDEVCPPELTFLDIETTGLGISPLFLIGTMTWQGNGFEVCQFLARTYAEEPGVISLFGESCTSEGLVVTFNGKSFDLPFIRARAAANGIPLNLNLAHFDLLHECRRIWKGALPDCRLQTLEALVCKRPRYGDIPGCDIPDAYHAYVRTEDATQMVDIVRHNMLDLVTLADLMSRLPVP